MSVVAPSLGKSAIPGDPWAFRALIARIANGGQSVATVRQSLEQQTLHGAWRGGAAAEYSAASGRCANNLANLSGAFDGAHYALARFVSQLEDAQATATRIASELQECEADRKAAEARAESARQSVIQARVARDAASSPDERLARQHTLSSAVLSLQDSEAAADDLGARATSLLSAASANRDEYDAAVTSLCAALNDAHTYAAATPRRSHSSLNPVGAPSPGLDDVIKSAMKLPLE